jgi:serine/threonine-protein kinase HipA
MPKKRSTNPSLPSVLEVRLLDTVVGTLTNLPNDQNLFVFDAAYLADPARPILSLSFLDAYGEVRTDVRPVTRRLPSFFSNLLPEGPLREYIAEHGQVNAQREFFLLWLVAGIYPAQSACTTWMAGIFRPPGMPQPRRAAGPVKTF